jgi:hypothetical protein
VSGGSEPGDTPVQESNPNAGGPARLEGDMGISSERTGPDGGSDPTDAGVQGTGTHGSAAESTDGTADTSRASEDTVRAHTEEPAEGPEMDDTQQEATQSWRDTQPAANNDPEADEGIDRTVGEANTAHVPSQPNDPSRNPGHSHG